MKNQATEKNEAKKYIFDRIGKVAQQRSGWVIGLTVIITLLLIIPLLYMTPSGRARDNPGGEVFDIRKEMELKLPPSVHQVPIIIEAKDGDMLSQKELWELYQNEDKFRRSDIGGDFLLTRYDPFAGTVNFGIYTIADAVQLFLMTNSMFNISLEHATDDQVKLAVHYILEDPESSVLGDWFSVKTTNETRTILGQTIKYWKTPAFLIVVNINNSKLPKETTPGLSAGAAGGIEHQKYNREVQEMLRGDERSYRLWGVAIDISLEAEEEGLLSIPLIIIAIVVILIIVSIYFRSIMITLITLTGLGMLIIWLKGFSNLLGLKSSLTLDIIVPIAILVLGVDYAIHSVHRYREARAKGVEPGDALRLGITGVGSALTFAMLTTVAAFLSNIYSSTEEITGFGIAAAVAIVAAYIIMGFFVPTVIMRWDTRKTKKEKNTTKTDIVKETNKKSKDRKNSKLSRLVCYLAKWRAITLMIIIIISITAGYYSTMLEAKLDAKEYFDGNSDFVISLDKLDEHLDEKGGEPAFIFIKGDLSNPETLRAIRQTVDNMDNDKNIAINPNTGRPNTYTPVFEFLEAVLESNLTISKIETFQPGITISDSDDNGIPDTQEQLHAIYDYIIQFGINLNTTTLRYDRSQIREGLYHDLAGEEDDITFILAYIPGTREQKVVKDSEKELTDDMDALDIHTISFYGLAGPAYERDATLDAVTNSLSNSIIIAVILCFIILLIAFRSVKYTIVTVIPIVLVAIWLNAFMYLTGFHLNAVTATIAAISIGVGIDYSVHITVRFRQELAKHRDNMLSLGHAAKQSGLALFGSAVSTMGGFIIIGFAPMPMFSSFGILTAIMILMALVAALLVLPSLLILIERKKEK
jgi:predicted RND superfamily exporter protein